MQVHASSKFAQHTCYSFEEQLTFVKSKAKAGDAAAWPSAQEALDSGSDTEPVGMPSWL